MKPLSVHSPDARVVTAPAGSGKTTLLLYHYLRLLKETTVERIVAFTFTRKAAAELTDRLATLLRAVAEPGSLSAESRKKLLALYVDVLPSREQAHAALAALDTAPVCTVDAFTLALVQEFVLHAHLPLGGGGRALLDGPVQGGADTSAYYEAAAREVLEALSPAAKTVLGELTLREAIADVAFLAAAGAPRDRSVAALLDALGDELRERIDDPAAWTSYVAGNNSTYSAPDAAARWLEKREGRPPLELLPWLARLDGAVQKSALSAVKKALAALALPPVLARAWEDSKTAKTVAAIEEGWKRADALRAAAAKLAGEARDEALRVIASAGHLGYGELLHAATALCEDPPPELAARYHALLVDELQDTNPSQLAFYRAFAGMRGKGDRALASFFVGDARQSIFRFRQADPHGWKALVREAEKAGGLAGLTTNYRSSKLLVAAQRAVVASLLEQGEAGVDPLEEVDARKDAPQGLLGGSFPAPVAVVDDEEAAYLDDHALALFARRLTERWAEHPGETAAVLVHSWDAGFHARDVLREHGIGAQLTGDRALLASRVTVDVRVFLRALLDPTDDVAMAAVLKHPSFGLTDRGLLLVKGTGSFARLLDPAFAPPLAPEAVEALRAPLAALRAARARLGRAATADVLEELASALHWRPVIEAGPEGEEGAGLAQLDIVLDIVRRAEADEVNPQHVVESLEPGEGGDDLPVVRLARGQKLVSVTTVFSAKGLEFDHVALLECGKKRKANVQNEWGALRVGHAAGEPILGVHLDPGGAFDRTPDPFAALANFADKLDRRGEDLRLLYVGFTRARMSVTLGLGKAGNGDTCNALRVALRSAAARKGVEEAILLVAPSEVEPKAARRPMRARTGRGAPFQASWAPALGQAQARPSDAKEHLDGKALAAALVEHGKVVEGRRAPALPDEPGLSEVPDVVLGDVVHGWLERWGFRGSPELAAAKQYLSERWSADAPAAADWLCSTGLVVRDGLPGFADLLARATALHFEWPLVGFDEQVVWAGRSDLVVELPDREVVVVDFKAGSRFATPGDIPHPSEYGAQLEAYRRMLGGAGYRVSEVGLVFARGVSWVRLATA